MPIIKSKIVDWEEDFDAWKNSNKCMWFAVVLKVESQLFSSLSWRYEIKMTWHLRRSGQEK